jgi:hypothetical protein
MPEETGTPRFVTIGLSRVATAAEAFREAAAGIDPSATAFVLALLPEGFERGEAEAAIAAALPGLSVYGTVTPCQITREGYDSGALQLLAFPSRHFAARGYAVEKLSHMSVERLSAAARRLAEAMPRREGVRRFALSFADSRAMREDLLISTLEGALDDIPAYGGSVGGVVYHDGRFHDDMALCLLVETDLEVEGLGFAHVLPTETRMVVTSADPPRRLVHELNGAPAAAEYARLVGCAPEALSARVFAEHPVMIRQNRLHYVRALRAAHPDGSLSFLSSIDDGLVLTLGRGKEVLSALETGLDLERADGRTPDFVFGFDCILRRLEISQKGLDAAVAEIFRDRRVVGLNTLGEQYRGLHLNQTFVGLAVFGREAAT